MNTYTVTFSSGSGFTGPTKIKADSIVFEDGFVKFYCPGSKNLVAAYPQAIVTGIVKVEE